MKICSINLIFRNVLILFLLFVILSPSSPPPNLPQQRRWCSFTKTNWIVSAQETETPVSPTPTPPPPEEPLTVNSSFSFNVNRDQNMAAFLLSGDVTDLGFNFQINSGRLKTERILNNANTSLFENIDTPDKTAQIIEYLVARGFQLIVSTSLTQGDAALNASIRHPNTFFVVRGSGNSSLPNVARITYDVTSADYMAGYFAGMNTRTNRVGIVIPGRDLSTFHHANSFSVGAYTAAQTLNKTITVFVAETGSYLNPDGATIAAWNLLANGADLIAQIQDDMTASTVSMNQGNLGIGSNGFPQRTVYGSTVGTSYVLDWSVLFVPAVSMVINNNWTVGWSLSATFANEGIFLDRFSYLVPRNTALAIRQEELKFMQNASYRPQNCYPPSCEIFNCTNGCIPNPVWIASQVLLPTIVDIGMAVVPLTEKKIPSGVTLAFTAIAIGFIIATVGLMITIVVLRDAKPIRSASPLFCIIILIGGIMVYVGVIIWVAYPSTIICQLRFWVVSLGYAVLVSNLVIKNTRIYILFRAMKNPRITNLKLLPFSIGILSLHVILLVMFSTIGQTKSIATQSGENLNKYEYMQVCHVTSSGYVIFYSILGVHGVVLLCGCLVSFRIRNVDIEEFNESKSIATFLYAVLFALFIIVPLFITSKNTINHIIILCVAFLFTTSTGLIILFLPKFIMIRRIHKNNGNAQDNISDFGSDAGDNAVGRGVGRTGMLSNNPHDIFSDSSSSVSTDTSDPDFNQHLNLNLPPRR